MLKMLKAVVVDRNGNRTTVKTYAQDTNKPEDVFAIFIQGGGYIEKYEWIDTLTEPRKQWTKEHPDNPIPLDL